MGFQPLLEVFGFPVSNNSEEAKRHRRDRLCPYGNIVPSCTKSSIQSPLGVCSIVHGTGLAITCPVRLRQRELITSHAREFFFPDAPYVTSVKEVRLTDANGRSAGNIDHIVIALDDEGQIADFGALEVQTVYISGSVRERFFKPYMDNPQEYLSRDWAHSKKQPPRPDYLSSSRKRLAPQLIYKGGILKAWGKKQAVAVHSAFFETLPELPTVEEDKADIVWLVYDFVHDPQTNVYNQFLRDKVYTRFQAALDKITLSEPGELNVFVKNLQSKLNKLRRGASTAQVTDAALDEAIDDGSDAEDMEGLYST